MYNGLNLTRQQKDENYNEVKKLFWDTNPVQVCNTCWSNQKENKSWYQIYACIDPYSETGLMKGRNINHVLGDNKWEYLTITNKMHIDQAKYLENFFKNVYKSLLVHPLDYYNLSDNQIRRVAAVVGNNFSFDQCVESMKYWYGWDGQQWNLPDD